jgi:hypothetical protein
MALASGGIFGCPRDMANETAPIITVDNPSAVNGMERKTKYARAESNTPVIAKLVPSVEYVFLNETAYTLLLIVLS